MGNLSIMLSKRLGLGFLTLVFVSFVIFIGVELLPGDIAEAILGQQATPEAIEAIRKELKLYLPAHERYVMWLDGVIHGDFGMSLANQRPIVEIIGWRFSNTILLAGLAAVISVPLSLILGILAALYRNRLVDRIVSMSALSTISFPEFFIGYILIFLFSVKLNIFPSMANIKSSMSFTNVIQAMIMPCLTLACVVTAHMMRMTRASIINLMNSPFIEMAKLKGFRSGIIVIKYALPNAISPIINVIVLNLAWLIAGVVVVEVVFVYPGLGQLLVDSVSKRDIPVVQACSLIFACTYILMNLSADVLAMVTNPRLLHPK